MAMTGPPPCGPWCMASDRDEHRRVADRRRHHRADRGLRVPVVMHVGVVEHDLAAPAQHLPVRSASHLMKQLTSLPPRSSARGRSGELQPGVADRGIDAVEVERVLHHAVADAVASAAAGLLPRSTICARVSSTPEEHEATDEYRSRSRQICSARGIFDFSQRDARCRGPSCRSRRPSTRALRRRRPCRAVRLLHRVDRQQRRLGLHVMHVGRIVDARRLHRRAHGGGDLLHHRGPADVLGQELFAERSADGEPGTDRTDRSAHLREHRGVRSDHAVAAAGPDHRHLRHLARWSASVLFQHAPERLVGEDAGEVIHAAVTLGLADHRHDLVGVHPAGSDQPPRVRRRPARSSARPSPLRRPSPLLPDWRSRPCARAVPASEPGDLREVVEVGVPREQVELVLDHERRDPDVIGQVDGRRSVRSSPARRTARTMFW